MNIPIITIVGRPNVGKSTLFNRIAGRRISIVSDIPGTTRDRVSFNSEWNDNKFCIIDTAGINDKSHVKKSTDGIYDKEPSIGMDIKEPLLESVAYPEKELLDAIRTIIYGFCSQIGNIS